TLGVQRHKIHDPHGAAVALDVGFKDHCFGPISLPPGANVRRRPKPPTSVLVATKESRKAGFRVEAWHAQPVDGRASRNQRCPFHVTDESVILDSSSHCFPQCHAASVITSLMPKPRVSASAAWSKGILPISERTTSGNSPITCSRRRTASS